MASTPPQNAVKLHDRLKRNGEWDRLRAVWATNIPSVRRNPEHVRKPAEMVAEEAWRLTLEEARNLKDTEKRLLMRWPPPVPETGDSPRRTVHGSAEESAKEDCRLAAREKHASPMEEFAWAEQHKSGLWSAINPSHVPSIGAYEMLQSFKGENGEDQYFKWKTAIFSKSVKDAEDKHRLANDNRGKQELIRQVATTHIESLGLTGNVKLLNVSCEECGAPLQIAVHSIAPVTLAQEEEVQVA